MKYIVSFLIVIILITAMISGCAQVTEPEEPGEEVTEPEVLEELDDTVIGDEEIDVGDLLE